MTDAGRLLTDAGVALSDSGIGDIGVAMAEEHACVEVARRTVTNDTTGTVQTQIYYGAFIGSGSPSDLLTISAVACDPVVEGAPDPCPVGSTCAGATPPLPVCSPAPVSLHPDGRLHVTCGLVAFTDSVRFGSRATRILVKR